VRRARMFGFAQSSFEEEEEKEDKGRVINHKFM
jgi:hypothetical protein